MDEGMADCISSTTNAPLLLRNAVASDCITPAMLSRVPITSHTFCGTARASVVITSERYFIIGSTYAREVGKYAKVVIKFTNLRLSDSGRTERGRGGPAGARGHHLAGEQHV
jgi:hypothetical protein